MAIPRAWLNIYYKILVVTDAFMTCVRCVLDLMPIERYCPTFILFARSGDLGKS